MDYDAIVKYIVDTQGVTVVEVLGMLEHQGVEVEGDLVAYYPYEPVVLWGGISRDVYEVLARLVADPRVEVYPTQMLTYLIDGRVSTLPLANVNSVNRRHPYKSDRWLPVVFNRR